MITIGIIGNGFVGSATSHLECNDIELLCYDLNPNLCKPKDILFDDLTKCSIIFVSVPTPMEKSGKCHLEIVEDVVKNLQKIIEPTKTSIVIRSTVPIGTCEKLGCHFMPEFLTEKNFMEDFRTCERWIFGVNEANNHRFKEKIQALFYVAKKNRRIKYNNLSFISTKEAETIKYVRNSFLATKVGFANEWYKFCEKNNINYNMVRKYGFSDKRIGLSHTKVPGHDGQPGFGGTCFPKHVASCIYQMKSHGVEPVILNAVEERNISIDRKEQDWLEDKGRAAI